MADNSVTENNSDISDSELTIPASKSVSRPSSVAPSTTGEGGPGGKPAEEEDDDDGSVGYEESAERDEIIRDRINRTQEQMREFMGQFSDEQLKRYETFRRVGFPRPQLKKLMQRVLDQQVNPSSVIVTAGIAKVFVGELVEGARAVMEEEIRAQLFLEGIEDEALLVEAIAEKMSQRPLEPFHVMEAHRRMKDSSAMAPHSPLYQKASPF